MSRTNISGRYALYKAGTQKIVRWLSETATRCGTKKKQPSPEKSAVTTADLVHFATVACNARPPVEISADVLEILADVIAGRQVCARWYQTQTNETANSSEALAESNDSHPYFISTLQEIRRLLQASRREQLASERAARKTANVPAVGEEEVAASTPFADAEDALSNLYMHLEREEPSAQALGNAPQKPSKSSAKPMKAVTLEVDEKTETRFALWCLLEDMYEIRQEIGRAWAAYKDGRMSFLAAGAITETAFGVMRRSNDEFTANYPEVDGLQKALDLLGLEFAVRDSVPCLGTVGTGIIMHFDAMPMRLLCPSAVFDLVIFKTAWLGTDTPRRPSELYIEPGTRPCDNFKELCMKDMVRDIVERLKPYRTAGKLHSGCNCVDPNCNQARFDMLEDGVSNFAKTLLSVIGELKLSVQGGLANQEDSTCDEFVSGFSRLQQGSGVQI